MLVWRVKPGHRPGTVILSNLNDANTEQRDGVHVFVPCEVAEGIAHAMLRGERLNQALPCGLYISTQPCDHNKIHTIFGVTMGSIGLGSYIEKSQALDPTMLLDLAREMLATAARSKPLDKNK